MFGTSAVNHDPFAARGGNMSAYEHFVVDEDSLTVVGPGGVFDEQFLRNASPRSSYGGSQRAMRFSRKGSMRTMRQRSRADSSSSSGGYFRLRRGSSVVSREVHHEQNHRRRSGHTSVVPLVVPLDASQCFGDHRAVPIPWH
ncbi:hypothetical protein PybrP1_003367 [[Pythium] brassicae (nom. inval.)]|nr:hypothetical protein PybrP1_003367 [[Pythium] brassicae (nom. inval.)]